MTLNDIDPIDRIALLVSTGLMLVSTVVLGIVELVDGAPFGATPLKNDAGEVIATPLVDPNIRTGIFVLGLVVLLLWGIYKMITPVEGVEPETGEQPSYAD